MKSKTVIALIIAIPMLFSITPVAYGATIYSTTVIDDLTYLFDGDADDSLGSPDGSFASLWYSNWLTVGFENNFQGSDFDVLVFDAEGDSGDFGADYFMLWVHKAGTDTVDGDNWVSISPYIIESNGDTNRIEVRNDYTGEFDFIRLGFLAGGVDEELGTTGESLPRLEVDAIGVTHPVPEPGTMMLLGSGLVGLAGWGRNRFRK